MNTFKEHVKKRTKTRQLAINNDNCSIDPEYEIPLTIEIYEQLEDLKTVALEIKGERLLKIFIIATLIRIGEQLKCAS